MELSTKNEAYIYEGTLPYTSHLIRMAYRLSCRYQYVISDLLDLDIQYKALWADYVSGTRGQKDYFAYDVTTYGPIIGLNFKF